MMSFCIHGQVYSLKNTRALVVLKSDNVRAMGIPCVKCGHKNRVISVPNDKAKAFERAFKKQIRPEHQIGYEGRVRVDITIYYPSDQQDLDEALVLDLLQRYKVIANDRQIVQRWTEKFIDPDDPRVEIQITPIQWERTGKQVAMFAEVNG